MTPLAGTRVVDMTNAIAGSSATKLLADLGAEVIKVESPEGGDFTRDLMPFVFQSHNRNKRSMAVDLRDPRGMALLHRLIARADVLVQSMRPGAMASLGLDQLTLAALNPRLIYASFSAFNPRGSDAQRRGVDAVAQAESGMVAMQGGLLGNVAYVDTAAGLALSHAILAALLNRERTGRIDSVAVNLMDTALYMQSASLAEYSVTGRMTDHAAYLLRHPVVGVFEASDGSFQISAYYERDWHALCQIIRQPGLANDERFGSPAARRQNAASLRRLLTEAFARRTAGYWIEQLSAAGILCGAVRSYDEVLAYAATSGSPPEEIELASLGQASFVRAPFSFNGQMMAATQAAPPLGADTDAILQELGLAAGDIASLATEKVVLTLAEPDATESLVASG